MMMKLLRVIALFVLAAVPARAAAYFIGPVQSTTTGRMTYSMAGVYNLAPSSLTITAPTITLDGMTGGVNASSANFKYGVAAGSGTFSNKIVAGPITLDAVKGGVIASSGTFAYGVTGATGAFSAAGALVGGVAKPSFSVGTNGGFTPAVAHEVNISGWNRGASTIIIGNQNGSGINSSYISQGGSGLALGNANANGTLTEIVTIRGTGAVGVNATDARGALDIKGGNVGIGTAAGIVQSALLHLSSGSIIVDGNGSVPASFGTTGTTARVEIRSASSNAQLALMSNHALISGQNDTVSGVNNTDMSFAVAGLTKLTLTSSSATLPSGVRLGVGTSNPAVDLDVNGSAQFGSSAQSTFTAAGSLNLASGASLTVGGSTVTSSGGITLTPGASLTVQGAAGNITSASSVTASAFFGNGGGLIQYSSMSGVNIAGSTTATTFTGPCLIGSTITVTLTGTQRAEVFFSGMLQNSLAGTAVVKTNFLQDGAWPAPFTASVFASEAMTINAGFPSSLPFDVILAPGVGTHSYCLQIAGNSSTTSFPNSANLFGVRILNITP